MAERFISRKFWANAAKDESGQNSRRFLDIDDFSVQLQAIYNELDTLGYDVVNVVPITIGQSEQCVARGNVWLGDVGFSITRGAVVVGKKRD